MLPKEIIKRINNPGGFEEEFINYLKVSKAPINQDKTIAYQVLSDARPVPVGSSVVKYFTGTFNQVNTNIQTGSYVRPESEHFLIYGIRAYYGIGATPDLVTWSRGGWIGSGAFYNSVINLVCNSVQYLKNVPVDQFEPDTDASENGGRATLWLDEPILWEGQTELVLEQSTKDPAGYQTLTACMRFDLVGIGLI